MEPIPGLHPSASHPGYLAEVTLALLQIRDTRTSGRLSIRNGERFGLAHLYFKEACLIHVTGDKMDGEIILNDLLTWSKGTIRFDPALMVSYESVTWQQAQIFARWLAFLEMRAIMQGIPRIRLDGFVRDLTGHLPGEPIAFPQQIANYEEHDEEALGRQWQRRPSARGGRDALGGGGRCSTKEHHRLPAARAELSSADGGPGREAARIAAEEVKRQGFEGAVLEWSEGKDVTEALQFGSLRPEFIKAYSSR